MKLSVVNKFQSIPNYKNLIDNIPVFATQSYIDFLKDYKDYNSIWFLASKDDYNYLIPFGVKKKGPFKKGLIISEVVSYGKESSIENEKIFLDSIITYITKNKLCDWIQQGPNWAIFNTYPNGAIYAPFGTYRIDLENKTEDELYMSLYGKVRGRINKSTREGIFNIQKSNEDLEEARQLIDNTLSTAKIESFTKTKVDRIQKFLKENIICYTTYFNKIPQSSLIYFYNKFSMYGIYAGARQGAIQGATEFFIWEAIKDAKSKGIKYFDFVGARINPDEDSKLYRIQKNKSHFGSELVQGYIWKMVINKNKYLIYNCYIKINNILNGSKNKGDIIDQERKRFKIK